MWNRFRFFSFGPFTPHWISALWIGLDFNRFYEWAPISIDINYFALIPFRQLKIDFALFFLFFNVCTERETVSPIFYWTRQGFTRREPFNWISTFLTVFYCAVHNSVIGWKKTELEWYSNRISGQPIDQASFHAISTVSIEFYRVSFKVEGGGWNEPPERARRRPKSVRRINASTADTFQTGNRSHHVTVRNEPN